VVLLLAEQAWQLFPLAVGCDFVPLRHAAEALLDADSVYRDPSFVYPPTAALILLPTAALGPTAAFACWLLLVVLSLAGAAAMTGRQLFPLTFTILAGGAVAQHSLYAGNLSPLLAPVAAGVLLAFDRGRWTFGCALLAASLLVKPLLAPLVLIPLVAGHRRALAVTMLPAGAALLASMALLPGGTRFPRVLWHTLTGSNLHGPEAVHNLSLRGWAESHDIPRPYAVLLAVALIVLTVRVAGPRDPISLGTVLLLVTFLAGRIAEVNYLFVILSTTMLRYARGPLPRPLLLTPGLGVLATPVLPAGVAGQTWLVAGELLLLAGLLSLRWQRNPPPVSIGVLPPSVRCAHGGSRPVAPPSSHPRR
jgi:hypothetical protein